MFYLLSLQENIWSENDSDNPSESLLIRFDSPVFRPNGPPNSYFPLTPWTLGNVPGNDCLIFMPFS